MEFDSDSFVRGATLFQQTLGDEVRKAMLTAGVEHDAEVLRDLRAGTGGLKLGANESGMRNSFKSELVGSTIDDLELKRFTNSRTAAAHEFGTVIRPKNAKMLTIPMPAARASGGTGRRRGGARSFKDAHFVNKGGKVYLVGKEGVLFHLVKSATIPARPFWYRVWNSLAERRVQQMKAAIERALGRFSK